MGVKSHPTKKNTLKHCAFKTPEIYNCMKSQVSAGRPLVEFYPNPVFIIGNFLTFFFSHVQRSFIQV
jgi:hypothetical protein